ncbi:MAG: hypothetical protein LBB57_00145 [Clostridiales Family XIII bacterium]|jgi:DNA-binding MarR family transcriptional regulator|nr:hypothetical protein [Clostridiales Family XIII bacterium]
MGRKEYYGYLLCFLYERPRAKRTASEAAKYANASRQTLYKHIAAFEDEGLLVKEDAVFSLTEKGRKYAAPLVKRLHDVRSFFETDFGCNGTEATRLALRMLMDLPLPASFVQKAADRGAVCGAVNAAAAGAGNPNLALPEGQYNVDFEVCRPGGRVRSMGDAGFFKPAKLSAEAGRYVLELRAKPFHYQSGPDKSVRGVLSRFWYKAGDDWVEAKKTAKRWFVPGNAIEVRREDNDFIGRVRFKAWATKSCDMPEGEGDIVLLFRRDVPADDFF